MRRNQRAVLTEHVLCILMTLSGGSAACLWMPAGAQQASATFTRQYRGTIGRSPIRMTLRRQGDRLSGSYRYVRLNETLRLQGALKPGRTMRIDEFYNTARTGTFRGRLDADGTLTGTWSKPDGTGALSFHLRPVTPETPVVTWADLDAEFLQTVARGDTVRARALLREGAHVNARDREGRTALILASTFHPDNLDATSFGSLHDRIAFVQYLLRHGADPNAQNKRGFTVLMYAVSSQGEGNGIIRILLDAGADIDARNDYGGTALMLATGKYGDESTVQLLIDAGANVNMRDKFGHTALSSAQAHHSPQTADLLKEAGAVE